MEYIILFEDNPALAHKRAELMPQHLQFLEQHAAMISAAGPLSDTASGMPAGGAWTVSAADPEAVQRLVETDPFWPTGLRKSVRILAWNQVFAQGQRKFG